MKKLYTAAAVACCLLLLAFPAASQDARGKSLQELQAAFSHDGYDVIKSVTYNGRLGVLAEHRTAFNYENKAKKRAIYVEGSGYEMGYLVGLLAPAEVERMATEFVDKIVFDFINVEVDPSQIPIIWGLIKQMLVEGAQKIRPDLPAVYAEEMNGLVDGCLAADPDSEVEFDNLLLLNVGFDAILSNMYALDKVDSRGLTAKDIELPVMCNAFSVFGNATADRKHYFGRDFMFPTAGVYEHMACLIVYRPTDGRIPMVSVAAPGFVGSIAGMNIEGIGMGVDMLPLSNCNWNRPGINSLLMVRNATHQGHSAQHALDTIVNAQRGVTWLYFVADGKNDRALVAESGMKTDSLEPLSYPTDELKWAWMIPDQDFLDENENQKHQQGVFVRWNDYKYPEAFHGYNSDLFSYYFKKELPEAWGRTGYINLKREDGNCPYGCYFAPQREDRDDVLIITNHAVVPSMRLCGMSDWIMTVAEHKFDDIQWRYDELNSQILSSYGRIDEQKAIRLIDYLAPDGDFPDYYKGNRTSTDGKTRVINGSVSLCNLTDRVIHSHFGYYADGWVSLTLPLYVEP